MKIPSPPLVILLDLLFIFLFISILNEDRVVSFTFPKNLPNDFHVVYFDKSRESYFYENNEPIKATGFFTVSDCDQHRRCTDIAKKYNDVGILLSDKILKKASKITTIAFSADYCKTLSFPIKVGQDGSSDIDRDRLLIENKCLEKIMGFSMWVKSSLK